MTSIPKNFKTIYVTSISNPSTNPNVITATSMTTSNIIVINSTITNLVSTGISASSLILTTGLSTGNIRLSDNTIYLRTGGDVNHSIVWDALGDGPKISGLGGGTLAGNGGVKLLWNSNGVGILNTSPIYSLDVSGKSRVTSLDISGTQPNFNNSTLGSLFIGNGTSILMGHSSDIYPQLHIDNFGHDNIPFMFDTYYDGNFRTSYGSTGSLGIGYSFHKTAGKLTFAYSTGTAGSNSGLNSIGAFGSSGNFGLGGQTSPAFPLDVAGTARITTSLTTGTLYSTNTITTSLTTGSLNVNGNIQYTGYNYVNSSTLTTGSAGTVLFATGSSGLYSGRFLVNALNGNGHSSFTIDVSGTFTETSTIQTPSVIIKRTQWSSGSNISDVTIRTSPANGTYLSTFFLTCASGVTLTITLLENVNLFGAGSANITLNTLALTPLTVGYFSTVYPLANTAILHGGMGKYINVNNAGVGINTTGGTFALDVNGSAKITTSLITNNLDVTGTARITTSLTAGSLYSSSLILTTGLSTGNIRLSDNTIYLRTGGDVNHGIVWDALGDGPKIFGTAGGTLVGNGTTVLLWNSTGVGIKNTAPSDYLQVANVMLMASTGNLTVTGDVLAFGTISDRRLKENINNINNGLETINNLRPVTFNWKQDIFNEVRRGTSDSGFIAQEVESVIPHAVSQYTEIESKEIYKNMRHERIIPYLVSAIKELKQQVQELQERIN